MTRKAFSMVDMLENLLPVVRAAGDIIMLYYRNNTKVDHKHDNTPVTEADRHADAHIVAALAALTPEYPVVSEEGAKPDITHAPRFWLVDPLDGTRSFVRGTGYFTVNIGLIGEDRLPLAGIIYDPVHRDMFWGSDGKAFYQADNNTPIPLPLRRPPTETRAMVSSHNLNRATEAFLIERGITQRIPCASSIKFCKLALGEADIYPRFGPTMEWDTAAGHAILVAAGGRMESPEGKSFHYGKPSFQNGNFVAFSKY